jgi:hypothetical protein
MRRNSGFRSKRRRRRKIKSDASGDGAVLFMEFGTQEANRQMGELCRLSIEELANEYLQMKMALYSHGVDDSGGEANGINFIKVEMRRTTHER